MAKSHVTDEPDSRALVPMTSIPYSLIAAAGSESVSTAATRQLPAVPLAIAMSHPSDLPVYIPAVTESSGTLEETLISPPPVYAMPDKSKKMAPAVPGRAPPPPPNGIPIPPNASVFTIEGTLNSIVTVASTIAQIDTSTLVLPPTSTLWGSNPLLNALTPVH